jgi:farnesyl-diphosphate farnesyltransferase
MAQGMEQLSDPAQRPSLINHQGKAIIESKADYDEYCYYVAGTVGQLVTELVILHYQLSDDVAHVLRPRAEACGRALQKTNIIKDFAEDLERGICYLPDTWLQQADYVPLALQGAAREWTAMVLADVLAELREATEYLLTLPYSAPGYRRAALLCLLPAYQTILSAARNQVVLFTPAHQIKISHQTMAQCLADAQAMLVDNQAIQRYSQRLEDEVRDQFGSPGRMLRQ